MRWRLEAELLAAGDAVAGECWSLLLGLCAEAAGVAGDAAGIALPSRCASHPLACIRRTLLTEQPRICLCARGTTGREP